MGEKELKNKLKEYSVQDVYFLKKRWRDLIDSKDYNQIQKEKGANLQSVYNIFKLEKIKSITKADYSNDRYKITLKHSGIFEINVFVKFDTPEKGKLGIITFYKAKIKQ